MCILNVFKSNKYIICDKACFLIIKIFDFFVLGSTI